MPDETSSPAPEPRGAAKAISPQNRRPLPPRKSRVVPSLLAEIDPKNAPPPHMAPAVLPRARVPQKTYKPVLERADPRLLECGRLIKQIDKVLGQIERFPAQQLPAVCRGLRGPALTIRRNLESLIVGAREEGSFKPQKNPRIGRRARA